MKHAFSLRIAPCCALVLAAGSARAEEPVWADARVALYAQYFQQALIPGSPGSVTVAPGETGADYVGGAREACGSAARCPQPHFARFEVSGEPNRSYTISAPSSISVAGLPLGAGLAPVLLVDAIQLRSASRPDAGSAGRLGADGRDRFDLGGTLRVPATTPPAHFRLSVEVIVTYG